MRVNPNTGFARRTYCGKVSADDVTIVAAPGAGWRIVVYSLQYTESGVEWKLCDSVPTTHWNSLTTSYRPACDSDPCAMFELPENEPLIVENAAAGDVYINLRYEIHPW